MRKKHTQSELESTLKKVRVPSSVSDQDRKEFVRQAAFAELQKKSQHKPSYWRFAVPVFGAGLAVFIFFGVGAITQIDNPIEDTASDQAPVARLSANLEPETVRATTIQSLQESVQQQEEIAVQPDKFHYSKVKIGTEDAEYGLEERIVETWEDPVTGNTKTITFDELGNQLGETLVVNGVVYEKHNFDAYNQYYQRLNADNEIFPGAATVGITQENHDSFTMRQIDERLTDAGFDTVYAPQYETTDFPGYDVPLEQIIGNTAEENRELFTAGVFIVNQEFSSLGELNPEVTEQLQQLQDQTVYQKRSAVIESLLASDDIETVAENWAGVDAIGIVNQSTDTSQREVWYFAQETAEYLGVEFKVVDSFGAETRIYEQMLDEATIAGVNFDVGDYLRFDGRGEGETIFSSNDLGLQFNIPVKSLNHTAEPLNSGKAYGADIVMGPVRSFEDGILGDSTQASYCGSEAESAPESVAIGVDERIEALLCEREDGTKSYTFDLDDRTIEISSLFSESLTDDEFSSVLDSMQLTR